MSPPRKPPAELDWTLDDAPEDDASPLSPVPAPQPPRHPRLTLSRRGLRNALLAVGVLGLAVSLVVYVGWHNLRAQVAAEAAYEDAQSLAGSVDAVLAVQADDADWRAVRAAEVAQHLPAPLPAAHLLPSGAPPVLTALRVIDRDLFEADLQRTWLDSSGQTFTFDYTQRYRNLGPGLWERVPSELITEMDIWDGTWVAGSFPLAESDFYRPLLQRLDDYLQTVCYDWRCPTERRVNLRVYDRLSAYSLAPVRPTWTPTPSAPNPVVFDLALSSVVDPFAPRSLNIPSLALAGRPHDAYAQFALLRALTAQALEILITPDTPTTEGQSVYLAALVARAETRLNLTPAFTYTPDPATYRSPQSAWALPPVDAAMHRADQQQALGLLNFALAGQSLDTDGFLLRELPTAPSVAGWLLLGQPGAVILRQWAAQVQPLLDAHTQLPRADLAGLAYSCGVNAALLTATTALPLPIKNNWVAVQPEALSPDGRYFAAIERIDPLHINLRLIDLATGAADTVDGSGDIHVLGWTPDGRLLYQRQEDVNQLAQFAQLDPLTQQSRPWLTANSAGFLALPVWWAPDHARLYLPGNQPAAAAPGEYPLARVAVAGEGTVEAQLLFPRGGTLSPDGHYAVGVAAAASAANLPATPAGLIVVSADAASVKQLVALDDLRALAGGQRPLQVTPLEWSANGATLAFVARGGRYGVRVLTINADASGLRELAQFSDPETVVTALAFSPDARNLAFQVTAADGAEAQTIVTDLLTGDQTRTPLAGHAGLAFAPTGHRLATVTQDGVRVTDLSTGAARWITLGACDHLAWYALPE